MVVNEEKTKENVKMRNLLRGGIQKTMPVLVAPGVGGNLQQGGSSSSSSCNNFVSDTMGNLNPLKTPKLEKEHVQDIYDTIADHWSHTRYAPWPRVKSFIESLPRGSSIADIGCGNGKNLYASSETGGFTMGCDISKPLVELSNERMNERERNVDLCVADCVNIPIRSNCFDAALSIAVLHHLSSKERRVEALKELTRILRPKGKALVYAWAFEQGEQSASRHEFDEQDVLVPWHHKLPGVKKKDWNEEIAQEKAKAGHGEVCREKCAIVYQRYCHVYREGELEQLIEELPSNVVVEDSWMDTGNWCIVVRKD